MIPTVLPTMKPIGASITDPEAMGVGPTADFDCILTKTVKQTKMSVGAEVQGAERIICGATMRDANFPTAECTRLVATIPPKMDQTPESMPARIIPHSLLAPAVQKGLKVASENIDGEPANDATIKTELASLHLPFVLQHNPVPISQRKVEAYDADVQILQAQNSNPLRNSAKVLGDAKIFPASDLAVGNSPEIKAIPADFERVAIALSNEVPVSRQPFECPVVNVRAERWIETMAREIVAAHSHHAETEMVRLRLSPEHLGTLEVEIANSSDGLLIDFSASNVEASKIIGAAESKLIDELRSKGIPLAESSLHSGSSGDGNPHRNGAIPRSVLPSNDAGREAAKDQDQQPERSKGRYA